MDSIEKEKIYDLQKIDIEPNKIKISYSKKPQNYNKNIYSNIQSIINIKKINNNIYILLNYIIYFLHSNEFINLNQIKRFYLPYTGYIAYSKIKKNFIKKIYIVPLIELPNISQYNTYYNINIICNVNLISKYFKNTINSIYILSYDKTKSYTKKINLPKYIIYHNNYYRLVQY